MITKEGKKWKLDFRPEGSKGRRIIRLFDTKGEALQYERMTLREIRQVESIQLNDDRSLTELIQLWYDLHGRSLKSSVDTKNRLLKLASQLGNPIARLINPELFAKYRKTRLDANVSPATINRELITLKALYRELKRLTVIDYESSILDVRKLRETKSELTYLTKQQLDILLNQVQQSTNESLYMLS